MDRHYYEIPAFAGMSEMHLFAFIVWQYTKHWLPLPAI